MWIDNDVEIVDDRFFTILDLPATAAVYDPIQSRWNGSRGWNTGVIIINAAHAERWVAQLDRSKHGDGCSFPTPDYELDPMYHSPRLFPTPGAWAVHWTGQSKWKYLERATKVRDGLEES